MLRHEHMPWRRRQAPEESHDNYLQNAPGWSQMSDIPLQLSNGGAAGDPSGRTALYAALNSSYRSR